MVCESSEIAQSFAISRPFLKLSLIPKQATGSKTWCAPSFTKVSQFLIFFYMLFKTLVNVNTVFVIDKCRCIVCV